MALFVFSFIDKRARITEVLVIVSYLMTQRERLENNQLRLQLSIIKRSHIYYNTEYRIKPIYAFCFSIDFILEGCCFTLIYWLGLEDCHTQTFLFDYEIDMTISTQ